MAEPYNLTAIYAKKSLPGLMQGANDLSNGVFGELILISFFIILFVAFKGYESRKAMTAASLLTAILAIFLRLLLMIDDTWMFGSFLITIIFFVISMWTD